MARQSYSQVQQELAQLEGLENNQLKQLLEELENKKQQFPVDEHAIIDWGISTLKAKILDKERFMSERDKAWEVLSTFSCEDFIDKYSSQDPESPRNLNLGQLDLRYEDDQQRLYSACYYEIFDILYLTYPDCREYQLERAVEVFRNNLYVLLERQYRLDLYEKYIDRLIQNVESVIEEDEEYRDKYQKKSTALFYYLECCD